MSDAANQSHLNRPLLWFGLLGGAGAWTAHLLLAYLIAEFACIAGKDEREFLGIMLPAWWLIGMSIVMVIVAASATIVSRGLFKKTRPVDHAQSPGDRVAAADRYMARTGCIMSGLFTFIIAAESIPIFFYLRSC